MLRVIKIIKNLEAVAKSKLSNFVTLRFFLKQDSRYILSLVCYKFVGARPNAQLVGGLGSFPFNWPSALLFLCALRVFHAGHHTFSVEIII
jgi:hypothetical protein